MKKNPEDKRERIIHAAMELIAENGFHASPTSLIAQNAQVGTGTIYRHFENKDKLIEEIYKQLDQRLVKALFAHDSEELPVRERFIRILTACMNYMLRYPDEFKFWDQYYNSPYGIEKKRKELSSHYEPMNQLMNYAKSQHIVKNLDNKVLLAIGFGPILYLFKDYLAGLLDWDEELIGNVVAACWDGLKR